MNQSRMPSDNLITLEEIKTLRAGAKTITPEIVVDMVAEGEIIPVVPIELKSGYLISMTIDKDRGAPVNIKEWRQDRSCGCRDHSENSHR